MSCGCSFEMGKQITNIMKIETKKWFRPLFLSYILNEKAISGTFVVLKPREDYYHDFGIDICLMAKKMEDVAIDCIDWETSTITCRSSIGQFPLAFDRNSGRVKQGDVFRLKSHKMFCDVHEFNEVCQEILDEFLEGFQNDHTLCREVDENWEEDAGLIEAGCTFAYTARAMRLYGSYCKRLYNLGCKLFPFDSDELEIKAGTIIEE